MFSPPDSHTILVFPYQRTLQYSDGNPPNGDVECRLLSELPHISQKLGSIDSLLKRI